MTVLRFDLNQTDPVAAQQIVIQESIRESAHQRREKAVALSGELRECACGCGRHITPRDDKNRSRRFIHGHNARGTGIAKTYGSFHFRVRRLRGTPSRCEDCGSTDPSRRYEWASLTGNYADISDYKRLCKTCHVRFDATGKKVGAILSGRIRADVQGTRHHQARLTEAQVIEIRQRAENGETFEALGIAFSMSDVHIGRIVHRINWKHLP